MPVKLKLAPRPKRPASLSSSLLRAGLAIALLSGLAVAGIFAFFYFKYQRIVDERLAAGPLFANAAQIYAAPKEIRTGQKLSASSIAQDLRTAGYNVMGMGSRIVPGAIKENIAQNRYMPERIVTHAGEVSTVLFQIALPKG